MLSVERSAASYIRVRASGLLATADYDGFEADFADELRHWRPPVRLLLDMRGFRGWTAGGFLRDVGWDLRHRKTFSKIAIIGDARWHKWITTAGALLFRAQLNYFPATAKPAAEQWLRRAARPDGQSG
jgi:hypothetical protein